MFLLVTCQNHVNETHVALDQLFPTTKALN